MNKIIGYDRINISYPNIDVFVSIWQAEISPSINDSGKKLNVSGKASPKRSDAVYQSLRRAIIEQALKPATRLPEDTIGDQFGVSRTVVRQALNRLQAEGLVETQPNHGACVAKPSLAEARDVFETRRCLEREVVRKLVERISTSGLDASGLDALESHIAQEDRVRSGPRRNSPRSIRLAGEFHVILAELTGNQVLTRYVSEVVSRCSLILAIYGQRHSSDCAVDEHRGIVQAIRDSDTETAMQIMDTHLDAVENRADLVETCDTDLKTVLTKYTEETAG